jgi:hypothetical protein
MVFEVLTTTGILPITAATNIGGGFVWPSVAMTGTGLLLAPMTRWGSDTPRNDPDSGDGWANLSRFRGTSATSKNLGGLGADEHFTTQAGLIWQLGGNHSSIYIRSRAAPTTNYMEAFLGGYVGTDLLVHPYRIFGSGTHTDWDIEIGFGSFNDLGDRKYVNCEYQTVSSAGTYGGSEASGGSVAGVIVIPFGGAAVLGRSGCSGLSEAGASTMEVQIV